MKQRVKLCNQYYNHRLAKRNGELVLQRMLVKMYKHNRWWNPFGSNYLHECSSWEDLSIPDVKEETYGDTLMWRVYK